MYDIKREASIDFYDCYTYKSKNSQNQIISFEVWRDNWNSSKPKNIWKVCFYITNKRKKGFQYLTETGKDGIKSLIWAKNCLIDFIEFCKNSRYSTYENVIIIQFDDIRRRNVYNYGLKSLGFKFGFYENRESLILNL